MGTNNKHIYIIPVLQGFFIFIVKFWVQQYSYNVDDQ